MVAAFGTNGPPHNVFRTFSALDPWSSVSGRVDAKNGFPCLNEVHCYIGYVRRRSLFKRLLFRLCLNQLLRETDVGSDVGDKGDSIYCLLRPGSIYHNFGN